MPAREVIIDADPCELAARWGVSQDLARRLFLSAEDFFFQTRARVWIISGYRTRAEQGDLRRRGRPTASDETSTHRTCPATGADVSIGVLPVRTQKHIWGRILFMNGLRWGGGSQIDENGIPSDWQHVDLGPRA